MLLLLLFQLKERARDVGGLGAGFLIHGECIAICDQKRWQPNATRNSRKRSMRCRLNASRLDTGGFNGGWNLVNVSEVMQYSHRGTC